MPLFSTRPKAAVAAFRSERAKSLAKSAQNAISKGDCRALKALVSDASVFTPAALLSLADSACRAPSGSEALLQTLLDAGMPPSGSFSTGSGERTPLQACLFAGNWEGAALVALALPMGAIPALHALEWAIRGLRRFPARGVIERQRVYNLVNVLSRLAPEGEPLAREALSLAGVSFDPSGAPRFGCLDALGAIENIERLRSSFPPLPERPSPPAKSSSPAPAPPAPRRILARQAPPRSPAPPAPAPSQLSSPRWPSAPGPADNTPSAPATPSRESVRQTLKRSFL